MLEFGILGAIEVRCDGRPLSLPGLASRRVLALLVLRPGGWLTADRLIDELWGERPPDSARKALQMHVIAAAPRP
jgi:DNA-binding SARP family transcriptional activator